ncbi:MAG: hypothetical protein R3B72_38540 [Polyangiaceae bacterium]
MESQDLIDRLLRPHRVVVAVTGPLGRTTTLTVSFPDLRSASRCVRGDWGPMYEIALAPRSPIEVLTQVDGEEPEREIVDIARLEIESPIAAIVRETTPLFTKLPLRGRGLMLRLFYDVQGRATSADLLPLEGGAGRLYHIEVAPSDDERGPAGAGESSQHAAE